MTKTTGRKSGLGHIVHVTRCLHDQPFHSGDPYFGWIIDSAFKDADKDCFIDIDAVGYIHRNDLFEGGFRAVSFFSTEQGRDTVVFAHEADMNITDDEPTFPNVRVYSHWGRGTADMSTKAGDGNGKVLRYSAPVEICEIVRDEIKKVLDHVQTN